MLQCFSAVISNFQLLIREVMACFWYTKRYTTEKGNNAHASGRVAKIIHTIYEVIHAVNNGIITEILRRCNNFVTIRGLVQMLRKYYKNINNLLNSRAMMSINVSLTTSYKIINTVLTSYPLQATPCCISNTLLNSQFKRHSVG